MRKMHISGKRQLSLQIPLLIRGREILEAECTLPSLRHSSLEVSHTLVESVIVAITVMSH